MAEYILATKDSAPQEGLRRLSLDIARGASPVGTWGHKFMLEEGGSACRTRDAQLVLQVGTPTDFHNRP